MPLAVMVHCLLHLRFPKTNEYQRKGNPRLLFPEKSSSSVPPVQCCVLNGDREQLQEGQTSRVEKVHPENFEVTSYLPYFRPFQGLPCLPILTLGLLLGDHLVTMGICINPWGAM